VVEALGRYCLDLAPTSTGNPFAPDKLPRLPLSHDKLRRMARALSTQQFASFTE
jgi:hypothetical protein